MINLKKIISTILITSVFCTLLICAMENHTIDEKGFNKCLDFIRIKFNMNLESSPIEFVKHAILKMIGKEVIRLLDGDDVADYFESFLEALSAENIKEPIEFCVEILSDNKTNLNLIIGLEENLRICLGELLDFYGAAGHTGTKMDILENALHKHLIVFDEPKHKGAHTPNSYGYRYLVHIAERVYIKGTLDGPVTFCLRRHLKQIGGETESQTIKSSQAGSSKLTK